jgi:hypothetical protein
MFFYAFVAYMYMLTNYFLRGNPKRFFYQIRL